MLDRARHAEDALAIIDVVEPFVQQPPWSFHADHGVEVKAGIQNLRAELVRKMEERRGEPLRAVRRVAVLTVGQISLDDRIKHRVAERTLPQPIEQRRESRYGGCGHDSSRMNNANGLAKSGKTIDALG